MFDLGHEIARPLAVPQIEEEPAGQAAGCRLDLACRVLVAAIRERDGPALGDHGLDGRAPDAAAAASHKRNAHVALTKRARST